MDATALDALMGIALDEARAAIDHGDVPIGAVVARLSDGMIVARRHNEREHLGDPTAHAEVLALRDAAAAVGSWRLAGHALVVTLEPCPMCAGAALAARIDAIAFGADDPKAGAAGSLYNLAADPRLNHEAEVIAGIRADEGGQLLARLLRRTTEQPHSVDSSVGRAVARAPVRSPGRDARAAESDGLENHCGASHPGFKSQSLRHVSAGQGQDL